ncbi:hypothetical protein ACEPAH_4165 [Sanghuangporus vaninii]
MVSPSELPAFIENLVKTWRTIKGYRELDETHKALMKRYVEISQRFEHLMTIVRDRSYYSKPTWRYINELIVDAQVAIRRALTIALYWKRRLGISEKRLGSRAWRLIPWLPRCFGKKMLLEWKETEKELAEFALKMDSENDCNDDDEEDDGGEDLQRTAGSTKGTKRSSYLKERHSEAVYMIVGRKELMSVMSELERLIECLNFAILSSDSVSISPHDIRGASDILKFVARAKRGRDRAVPVNFIERKDINAWALSDIDADTRTGIYCIPSGPYAGCIVDPRDISQCAKRHQEDVALKEMQDIVRLFVEDPGAPESQLRPQKHVIQRLWAICSRMSTWRV